MINIAFFEDHPIVTKSLNLIFENTENLNLVFNANSKIELYTKLENSEKIDVIILDIIAIDVQGLEVFETITKKFPLIKQIAFTTLTSPILVENLLSVGAKGYVNKNQETEDLLKAIYAVTNGEVYLPDDYEFLTKKFIQKNAVTLTNKEIEIMQLIIKEYTTVDIATQLLISVNTVENHRKSIFQKFNVKNVAGMVREASKLGFIN